jgi:hypothetical protein
VVVPKFPDPAIYTIGRQLTIVGAVTGKENYLYLWPVENTPDSEPRVVFGIGIGIGS